MEYYGFTMDLLWIYYGILWNTMEYYGHPELRTTPAYPMDPICWIRHFINIALANLQEPRLKTKRRESMPWDAHFHIFAGPVQHCNARTW